jgi:hypothetical protein
LAPQSDNGELIRSERGIANCEDVIYIWNAQPHVYDDSPTFEPQATLALKKSRIRRNAKNGENKIGSNSVPCF